MSEFQDKMLGLLKEKEALSPCPRCGNEKFAMYAEQFALSSTRGGWVGGYIPCAIVVCKKCGYMVFHSIEILEGK